jgi:hypothetical protein
MHLSLKNSGDLPAYPFNITLHQDSSFVGALLLPTMVLPFDNAQITCFMTLPELTAQENHLTISVFDKTGNILVQSKPTVSTRNPVGSWTYSWYFLGQNILRIPQVDWFFDYYHSLDRFDIIDYSAYVFDPYDDQYIDFLVHQILSPKQLTN